MRKPIKTVQTLFLKNASTSRQPYKIGTCHDYTFLNRHDQLIPTVILEIVKYQNTLEKSRKTVFRGEPVVSMTLQKSCEQRSYLNEFDGIVS